jgi:hypothetical protein
MKRINIKVKEWATGIRPIVMAIAIGLFAVSCGKDDGDGKTVNLPAAKGHLTVTGLAAYNDMYILALGSTDDYETGIIGCTEISDVTDISATYHCVKIKSGKAEIPLYYATENGKSFKAYDRSDKNTEFSLMILEKEEYKLSSQNMAEAYKDVTVSFNYGDATVDWAAGGGGGGDGITINMPPAIGYLTVTGLAAYNNKYIFVSGATGNDDVFIYGCTKLTGVTENGATYHAIKIVNGSAQIPLYYSTETDETPRAYNRNDQNIEISVMIATTETFGMYMDAFNMPFAYNNFLVGFTGGNATVNWADGID